MKPLKKSEYSCLSERSLWRCSDDETFQYCIDETVIKAELQKMKMSGDTLVYNTGAFKTSEGAVLQDLVRQLPGLELDEKSGKMNFHGKEITQILLNGKEFLQIAKLL